jgi:hypothetical protein
VVRFVTKDELRGYAAKLTITEQASVRKSASSQPLGNATFLSHSSKDKELVVGAIKVLEGHGAKVYIDEIDPEMPPYTSEETAGILKSRIQQTQRFVLLASANSKDSRWVPWELGVADGYKSLNKIALFPAAENSSEPDWASWEYLGLYHRIVWGKMKGRTDPLWMVLDHKRFSAIPLNDWLVKS